jgi:hypothetical protein
MTQAINVIEEYQIKMEKRMKNINLQIKLSWKIHFFITIWYVGKMRVCHNRLIDYSVSLSIAMSNY